MKDPESVSAGQSEVTPYYVNQSWAKFRTSLPESLPAKSVVATSRCAGLPAVWDTQLASGVWLDYVPDVNQSSDAETQIRATVVNWKFTSDTSVKKG